MQRLQSDSHRLRQTPNLALRHYDETEQSRAMNGRRPRLEGVERLRKLLQQRSHFLLDAPTGETFTADASPVLERMASLQPPEAKVVTDMIGPIASQRTR